MSAGTEDLALARIGEEGPASAEANLRIAAARTAGVEHWRRRVGRPLTEAEEDAIVVLADGLVRTRRDT